MIERFARYRVKKEALPQALPLIETFVDEVTRKEGGTAKYAAFQEVADPTRFEHHVVFRTPAAEKYHATTPWGKTFFAKLAPLCDEPLTYVDVKPVGKA